MCTTHSPLLFGPAVKARANLFGVDTLSIADTGSLKQFLFFHKYVPVDFVRASQACYVHIDHQIATHSSQNACFTPASPSIAKPCAYGHPTCTLSAPRARALMISAPHRMPLSKKTSGLSQKASTIRDNIPKLLTPPSCCLPPRLLTTIRCTLTSTHPRASAMLWIPLSKIGLSQSLSRNSTSPHECEWLRTILAHSCAASPRFRPVAASLSSLGASSISQACFSLNFFGIQGMSCISPHHSGSGG